ncbi:serine/threonine-protein kinase [Actinoplanes subtropicus]|uniref:serine/threonine-protein kinase n=1 Tax=Actinoplanes subtropicus TaxID=543632 RepID=UPI0004C2DB9D|nr:serine/threonine-protein kinase [Actinoplanes subtropicus]
MTAEPGLLAGRYRVTESLGEGGMGRVWLARDVVLDRDVAVKEVVLPPDLVARERDALRRRTLREARAAARLTHRNVAQVFDVFEADGHPWIVLEHVRSRSLQEVLDAEGPLEPRRVAEIGLAVLAALRAAHRAGVRHRDVKPSNVLLAGDGRVVLTDFGIATIEDDGNTTSSELLLGSPQFMAPERALRGESGPASDLWSLGATLYAAVEGRPPYQRPSAVGTLMALAAEEPEPPHRAGKLRPVLDGLLRKDPEERIDAEEARRRLLRAAEPVALPAASGIAGGGWRRRPVIVALVVVVALLAVAATVVVARGGRSGKGQAIAPAPSSLGASAVVSTAARPTASAGPSTPMPPTSPAGERPPTGWIDYHDPTGFSVYVPKGWTRSQRGSIVYFRGAGRVLGIDQTTHPNMNPVADWRGKAGYRVAHGDFPGYREIRIEAVKYFVKAADWEFTFDGSRARQHVNNRGVVVNDHQAYGIYWQAPDASWGSAYADLQLVFGSFRPRS